MKRSVKSIAILLLAAMLLPACANDTKNPSDTSGAADSTTPSAVDSTTEPTETTDPNARANHFDALPADLTFDGATVNCLFRGTMDYLEGTKGSWWIVNDVCGTDNIGEEVSDAVWQRNIDVAERLDIELIWTPTDTGNLGADQTFFRSLVQANDDSYQFYLPTGNTSATIGLSSYMRDVASIPYVDWESPWWWQFANDALSLDGKTMQFVVGDMLLTNLTQTCVMYFNKDLYDAEYGDPDAMYQLVLDGKFTIDKLNELSAGAYIDNGDGTPGEGDTFGLLWSAAKTEEMAGYVAACDLDLCQRGEDGYFDITMNNERTITAIEKLYALLNENAGSRIGTGLIADQATPFAEGVGMFLGARLTSACGATLREMEQEYGIIPMPKLDEDQERYLAGIHESGTVLCVPKTTDDENFALVGATWEALCGEAHRKYMDAFLETALKLRYSRDALSGQCIDIIIDGLTKLTLNEYSTYSNNIISSAIYNSVINNPSTFTSYFRKAGTAAQNKWDKAIADLDLGAE